MIVGLSAASGQTSHSDDKNPPDQAPPETSDVKKYDELIQQLTTTHGGSDQTLIEPLTGLGQVYLAAGAADAAVETFERAIQISRLNFGLHNLQQLPLIDQVTEAYGALGLWSKAYNRQRYAYFLQVRQQGEGTLASLPAIKKIAEWSFKSGQLDEAELHYQKMLKTIEYHRGKEHLTLTKPLLGLVAVYLKYYQHLPEDSGALKSSIFDPPSAHIQISERQLKWAQGTRALKRILRLRQKDVQTTPLDIAQIVAQLGDWYTLYSSPSQAASYYKDAISLLLAQPGYENAVNQLFGTPKVLHFPEPKIRARFRQTMQQLCRQEKCFVEYSSTVNRSGDARNLSIVASHPPEWSTHAVKYMGGAIKYRPAFRNNEAVVTAGVRHRYEYPN